MKRGVLSILDMFWKKNVSYLRLLLYFIVAILFVKEASSWIRLIRDFPLNDFSVYIDGAKTQLAGENPYTQWFFDRYNYPPFATVLFTPFTFLPIDIAEAAMTLASIMSLWLIVHLMNGRSSHGDKEDKRDWTLIRELLLFVLLWRIFPVRLTLALGQVNIIILCLIVFSFYCYKIRRTALSGMFLGLATAIKLTPLPILLFYVMKREWKVVVSFLFTVLCGAALGILVFGISPSAFYYGTLLPTLFGETTRETLKLTYMNQSSAAFLGRFGIFGPINTGVRLSIAVTLLILVWRKLTMGQMSHMRHMGSVERNNVTCYFLLVVATMLFFPSFVWQHHYVALIPVWLLFVENATRQRHLATWMTVIIFYIAMNFYFANTNLPVDRSPFIATHFLIIGIAMWVIALWKTVGIESKKNEKDKKD